MPLTFGYSAAQRSRIKNGENVSSANRYIAENPANAFAVQMLAPVGLKTLSKMPQKTADKALKAKAKIERAAKKMMEAGKEANYCEMTFDKTASFEGFAQFNF